MLMYHYKTANIARSLECKAIQNQNNFRMPFKIKHHFLLLFFLFIGSSLLLAQKETCGYSLRGKVLDANTEGPIFNAVIKVKGIEKYTTTNAEGAFKIDNLCTKNNTLIISCLSYSNSTKDHEHDSAIHFFLTQQVTGLNEVVIQAKRRKEKGTATISQVTIGKAEITSDPTQSLAASLSQQ
jgi:iron complex outermembrane receptor protein